MSYKLTPYREILKMSKDAINGVLAFARANSAKRKAEHEMAKIDERIATIEMEIQTICAEKDLDFDKIIRKLDDIDLQIRRRAQFQKIVDELFPSDAAPIPPSTP